MIGQILLLIVSCLYTYNLGKQFTILYNNIIIKNIVVLSSIVLFSLCCYIYNINSQYFIVYIFIYNGILSMLYNLFYLINKPSELDNKDDE